MITYFQRLRGKKPLADEIETAKYKRKSAHDGRTGFCKLAIVAA